MAGNPQVAQGTLNKVRSSVIVTGDNTLNVTAPFLGRNMVSVAFQGDASLIFKQHRAQCRHLNLIW